MIHTLQNGKFAILKVLGQGGFGITYEASNTKIGKRVAIKELFLDNIYLRGNDDATVTVTSEEKRNLFERQKNRFIQEAGKLAQLSHPHIVAVHDLFEENGTAYYVMDYIEGESLAAHLARTGQPMKENEVLNILNQVLDALAYLHAQKPPLLHLDIKPDNLMRKEDGNIVLIDFGASKNMPQDGKELSTTLAYTPCFAPQEKIDYDMKNIGPWTDFYSLGATMYNLLTNKRPPNTTELLKDKTEDMSEALPFPVSVSTPMRHLVRQLMSIDLTKRTKSVEEIREILINENFEKQLEENIPDEKNIMFHKSFISLFLGIMAILFVIYLKKDVFGPYSPDENCGKKFTSCPDNNHPHAIDLGLPSGTMWACCNVGADKPEEYGEYYAWGEAQTKSKYDWSSYKHCEGSKETCHNLGGDIAGTEYDVAHVIWGGSWMMPSLDQIKELHDNCTYKWTTMNGIEGGQFTSKNNGDSIFLPAAGNRWDDDLSRAGSHGYYWSSTQHPSDSNDACSLYFYSGYIDWDFNYRRIGRSVRPVKK